MTHDEQRAHFLRLCDLAVRLGDEYDNLRRANATDADMKAWIDKAEPLLAQLRCEPPLLEIATKGLEDA